MPELPEVEVVRAGLERHLCGHRLSGVTIYDSRSARGDLNEFVGREVSAVVRRGKYLWIRFGQCEDASVMVAHLKMSGQLLVDQMRFDDRYFEPVTDRKHKKIELRFEDAPTLTFVDQRVFGYLGVDTCVSTRAQAGYGDDLCLIPRSVSHIGRDFMDAYMDDAGVIRRWKASRRAIKAVLLDQGIASGLGNIYTDETLFRVGLDPRKRASAVPIKILSEVMAHARDVLSEAVAAGGTSFDALYVNAEGQPGYFSRELKVYGRGGKPCVVCGTQIRRIKVNGRGSHTCPNCQPYGRRALSAR